MSDGTNGQAAAPAGGESDTTGREAGNDREPRDYVTLADDDDEGDGDDAGDESGEGEGDDGQGEGEDEQPPERDEQRVKRSGSARLKARLRALEDENRALRHRQAPHAPANDEDDELVEPKESDFPNDYLAFDRARRAFETRQAIREESKRSAASQKAARAQADHEARVAGYNVRLDAVKSRIPDFDTVMSSASQMEIRDDVRDLLLESSKGPLLAYHLAKHPEKVSALNRMSPAAAAKEIGSLEARIRGPQPKTRTKAPPPKPAPKGGGSDTRPRDPAKMSFAEYQAWRKGGGGTK
jgi:hypothetical protein